jgi:ribosomal subunit interface protein
MNIIVKAHVFSLTPALETAVRERLTRALRRFDDNVVAIEVSLKDVNGPRGGADKQVLVLISLRQGRLVPVEAVHADLYTAIQRSADRARRAVKRALNKRRRINKRALRRLRLLPTAAAQPA